jgi:hypothetical protein
MVGLVGFSALSVDYGVFWLSRRQAQNSADAGALAGAIALAFDNATDKTVNGPASRNAFAATQANLVFGLAPSVTPATDITFNPCSDDGDPNSCIQVKVYRTVARGNALPTFFARLFGIVSQDIQAYAEAKALQGNATECMRPWAVLDKWDEYDMATNPGTPESEHLQNHNPPAWGLDPDWNMNGSFDRYPQNPSDPPFEDDYYERPALCPPGTQNCDPGTGFRLYDQNGQPVDYGRPVNLKTGSQGQTTPGWFMPIRLSPQDQGAADYCQDIKQCSGTLNFIGQTVDVETGNMVGPTSQCTFTDADSLKSKDPNAYWDPNYFGTGHGAVVGGNYGPNQSPRIVPIAVVDPDEFLKAGPNGMTTITIRNILGFFVDSLVGQGGHAQVRGYLINVPGLSTGGNTVAPNSNFVQTVQLIR